jgi:hypothetical protein
VVNVNCSQTTEALFDVVNNQHRVGLFAAWFSFANVQAG